MGPLPLVLHSDCLPVMRSFSTGMLDAVVTDPPYALRELSTALVVKALTAWLSGDREYIPEGKGFMGREWDSFVPPPAVWDECFRTLKPGAHMAVFAGSRTADLMGLSIRLAGFEIRDTITWMYASGFPKSKTVLKPASEPIIMARKPFKGSEIACIAANGTGGLNIDTCRVAFNGDTSGTWGNQQNPDRHNSVPGGNGATFDGGPTKSGVSQRHDGGRWPANVVLTHASTPEGYDACAEGCVDGCSVAELDTQSGIVKGAVSNGKKAGTGFHANFGSQEQIAGYADTGGASRFYNVFRYQAKAPKSERPVVNGKSHPAVKPLALMCWLVTLVTPPGGRILDPFAGSGTTGQAAQLEGFRSILIERDLESIAYIRQRLDREKELLAYAP